MKQIMLHFMHGGGGWNECILHMATPVVACGVLVLVCRQIKQ